MKQMTMAHAEERIEALEKAVMWLVDKLGYKIGHVQGQIDAHLKLIHGLNADIKGPTKKQLDGFMKEIKKQWNTPQ